MMDARHLDVVESYLGHFTPEQAQRALGVTTTHLINGGKTFWVVDYAIPTLDLIEWLAKKAEGADDHRKAKEGAGL